MTCVHHVIFISSFVIAFFSVSFALFPKLGRVSIKMWMEVIIVGIFAMFWAYGKYFSVALLFFIQFCYKYIY